MSWRAAHNSGFEADLGWPPWADKAACVVPVCVTLIALQQRHAFSRPSWALAWAAVVVLPWLLAAAGWMLHPFLFSALALAGLGGLLYHPAQIDMAVFVLVYLAGQMGVSAPLRVSLPIAAVAMALMVALDAAGRFSGVTPWVAGIALAWLAACAFQKQAQLFVELKLAQAGLAEKAASEERQRIAREVHDVIAHSLTVTLLHIGGARLAVETAPEEAAEALAEAERLGRQSLAEIRQTVGLLKAGDADAHLAPMPAASDISALVTQFASAGLPTQLDVGGDIASVPPAIGLVLYRIVQESLANVAKHAAGASALVKITVEPERVGLSVTNNGGVVSSDGSGSGVGITGMKERAAVLGGRCEVGPSADGWAVEVSLPRAGAAE